MNYTELVKPFDSPAKTILIVDDEESIRKTLKYILSKIGYEVKTAEHARVAYEILNNHSIDLVISDIIMPDITGIELVEHIKKQYRPPEILLITGDPSLETATSAVKLGVFDYISKPIKKSTLLNVVHQALEKKALLDEKERLEQQNQRYLHDLEQKLDQRTYRLLLTEERYRNLFENMSVGVGISNLAGNVLEVNSTMCSITGYSPDEFKKISLANTLVDSNAKQKILDELNSSGTLDNYEVELYRANGSTYWASISAIKIMYRTQTAFLTTQIDISARKKYEFSLKRALADKEEMLREIHHRTKNNMNVIISLLNMQSYASDDEHITDILKKVSDRIFSMSLVHEQVYLTKELSSIDLSQYVNSLFMRHYAAAVSNTKTIKYKTDLAEVKIGLSQAIPLGLALNEILLNAVKHPFEDGAEGLVIIKVEKVGQSIMIMVRDNGKGFPKDLNLEDPLTLGLHMAKILVEDQLRGKLKLTSDKGAIVQLSFPMDIDQADD